MKIKNFSLKKLDDNGIHFLYARKFCRRPTLEVSASSEQSLCPASIERAMLVTGVDPKCVNSGGL